MQGFPYNTKIIQFYHTSVINCKFAKSKPVFAYNYRPIFFIHPNISDLFTDEKTGSYICSSGARASPDVLATAALYIAALLERERRTQREIARVTHVTDVTIRSRYKELILELKIQLYLSN